MTVKGDIYYFITFSCESKSEYFLHINSNCAAFVPCRNLFHIESF